MSHKRFNRSDRQTMLRAAVSGFVSGVVRYVAAWMVDWFQS
ncbi:hypothetical protein ACWDWU_00130 [Streptomyces sp. NPDC003442]